MAGVAGFVAGFVALGDSFTEGLDDARPDGSLGGWADRTAEVLAARTPGFRYANLAVRGVGLRHVLDEQLPAAVAMGADLVSIAAGGNDVLRPRFDVSVSGQQMDDVIATLSATGATVLVFAGFGPPGLPFGSTVAARAEAYNDRTRESARRHGAILVDLWKLPALAQRRMWSPDRLHLSSTGHAHVCGVVLSALGVEPPFPWPAVLEPVPPPTRLEARWDDLVWGRRYFLPWLGRRLTGRSSGDGRGAKRPELVPLALPALRDSHADTDDDGVDATV